MKKTLLTLFMAFAAICGMAQTTYNEKLIVDINGTASDSIPATISVTDNGDGTCSFSLKNFKLIDGEDELPVGNIQLEGVTISTEGGISTLQTKQEIKIAEGDDASIDWVGPALGVVPIDLQGKLTADHMYAVLNIDMREAMDQMIKVTVGQEGNIVAPAPAPAEGTIYNEKLIVDINGSASDSISAVINVVDNGDGTCSFSLKNFKLIDGEDELPVGNIQLDGVEISTVDGISTLQTKQEIKIAEGDDSSIDWVGPALGIVPIDLQGKLTADHMYAVLNIDMREAMDQMIKVTVGQEGNVTSIKGIEIIPTAKSQTIYSLDGRRVSHATKGVYIINGKKVIK